MRKQPTGRVEKSRNVLSLERHPLFSDEEKFNVRLGCDVSLCRSACEHVPEIEHLPQSDLQKYQYLLALVSYQWEVQQEVIQSQYIRNIACN